MGVLLRGAIAGAVATGPMSGLMFAVRRSGLMGEMPPERITARALDAAGIRRSRETQDWLAAAAHAGFGAAAGAAFAVLSDWLHPPLPPALQGALFGTGVWASAYLGWVPALGIMPPGPDDGRLRAETMYAAHLVYGAVLGILAARNR